MQLGCDGADTRVGVPRTITPVLSYFSWILLTRSACELKPEAKSLTLAILTRIREREGSASKTKLLKLLYLADIEHYRKAAETLTGFDWVFYLYGPWANEYDVLLKQLADEGVLRSEGWTAGGQEGERLSAVESVDLGRAIKDNDTLLRTRRLVDVWADQGVPTLLDYVYFETEPMQGAEKMARLDFSKVIREVPPLYRRTSSGADQGALKRLGRRIAETREKLEAEIGETTKAVKPPVYDDIYIAASEVLNAPEAE